MTKFFVQLILALYPITVMALAAFLIYKQVPGWGWFLTIAFLLLGSTSIKLD